MLLINAPTRQREMTLLARDTIVNLLLRRTYGSHRLFYQVLVGSIPAITRAGDAK